jgi:hypothetical protein
VPGKKFFISLTDSTGAKAYGDEFVVAAATSTTTSSASTSSTAKSKSTSSKTSATTSSTGSSSTTSSSAGSKGGGGLSTGAKVGIGVGVAAVFLLAGGVFIAFGAAGIHKIKEKRKGATNDGGVDGIDGAGDARLAEKRGLFGFWSRKGGEKGYTGVALVHELQANDRPGVQELDSTVRHELQ